MILISTVNIANNHITYVLTLLTLNPMGGPKMPPTSFTFVPSTNVRISPKNFQTFSFNPFATLV